MRCWAAATPSAFQSYPLKKKPLTYLPSTDPEGLAAVENTLIVTVNGVRWKEEPTLLEERARRAGVHHVAGRWRPDHRDFW